MVTSVNGNALAALQARENALANRPQTAQLQQAGDRAATGRNTAVVYGGAAEIPSLSAVLSAQDSLNRAAGVSDVVLGGGQVIAQLLATLRERVAAAQTAPGEQRGGLDADYQQLLGTIDQIANSAAFQGVKLLDGRAGDQTFKADVGSDVAVTLAGQDFTVGGSVLKLAGTSLLGSPQDLVELAGKADAAAGALAQRLSQIKAQSEQIQGHLRVVGQLHNALAGQQPVDLDADTARLQALQIQQALSGQGAGIANQTPQAVLALFRAS